ncbi:MAG: phosphomannomutase [Deferrisomatales bacterium]
MAGDGKRVGVAELMAATGVAFGTSGARGRVADMTDRVCYAYTAGFLQYLEAQGQHPPGGRVALGGDLRPSTGRILQAVAAAVRDRGGEPVHCGRLPSPALALFGMEEGIPTAMVTGSHIPDDRNGIKFTQAAGEILKDDEAGIRAQRVWLPADRFRPSGALRVGTRRVLPPPSEEASERYAQRYLRGFPRGCLEGLRVGVYEHSAVGPDLLCRVLEGLGAAVERRGRSERFVPVDTEAVRPEDEELARRWAAEGRVDALVSTDGDGDRPLVGDEAGRWLRGDVAGILVARFLGADAVAVPVSANTAVELSGWFRRVVRTRIGSPYVIEGMARARQEGFATVVGYEANGGFLTASSVRRAGVALSPLPTRDALVVILSLLVQAARAGVPVSGLVRELPARFTASGRVGDFPTAASAAALERIGGRPEGESRRAFAEAFAEALGREAGEVAALDRTDGLRAIFRNGEILHVRPSGNAPELRCYVEAASEARARELLRGCLAVLERWRGGAVSFTPPPRPGRRPSPGTP